MAHTLTIYNMSVYVCSVIINGVVSYVGGGTLNQTFQINNGDTIVLDTETIKEPVKYIKYVVNDVEYSGFESDSHTLNISDEDIVVVIDVEVGGLVPNPPIIIDPDLE